MQAFARWIARRIWWASLWLMRRRWMRAVQRGSLRWMRPERRERAWEGIIRQNAFARRIGLRLLYVTVLIVLVSLAFQIVYSIALYLVQSGTLGPRRPDDQ